MSILSFIWTVFICYIYILYISYISIYIRMCRSICTYKNCSHVIFRRDWDGSIDINWFTEINTNIWNEKIFYIINPEKFLKIFLEHWPLKPDESKQLLQLPCSTWMPGNFNNTRYASDISIMEHWKFLGFTRKHSAENMFNPFERFRQILRTCLYAWSSSEARNIWIFC